MFTREKEIDGVVQRDFAIDVDGEPVPAVIYSKEGATGSRPLILMGHGGSQHKKTEGIRIRAVQYANEFDWATLAIDAPGHGDRISREEARQAMIDVGKRVRGETSAPFDVERMKQMMERMRKAVPEWHAALDAALEFDFVNGTDRIGYWGVSMGTAIGVPFVSTEPRIQCAVFGLAGVRASASDIEQAARKITIPVEYVFQWEDAVAPRESGIALFNAFSSKEKTMHINPGGHMDIPNFEGDSWKRFFYRHLCR